MEKIIETHCSTIHNQQIRVKKLENENYRLEHKLRLDSEQCEERVLLMQKELLSMQQINEDLQIFEKGFKESNDKIVELKRVIDRVTQKNNNLQNTISRQTADIQRLKKTVHGLETEKKVQRHQIDALATENRNHIRDMKKMQEMRSNLNRRIHQLSKKYAELSDNEYLMT